MTLISLNTAAQLAGVSKRTLWRRIAASTLSASRSADPQGRTLLSLADIAKDIGLTLDGEVIAAIQGADTGLARDQLELALIFLEAGLPDKALPWLRLAVNQGDADAMLILGETQLEGWGADTKADLLWIRRAAIAGHPLALAIMEALPGQLTRQECPGV
jgi:TPR repeat protein